MKSARTYRHDHASPMRQVWIAMLESEDMGIMGSPGAARTCATYMHKLIIGLAAGRARGGRGRLEKHPPHKPAPGGY